MPDFVQSAILKASLEPTGYEAGANKIKSASDQVVNSADRVSAATEKVGRTTTLTQQQFDRFQASYDKTYRAQQQYETALDRLNRYQTAGIATGERYSQTLQAIEQRYQKFGGANDNAVTATGRLNSAMDGASVAFGRAAQFAGLFGASLGIGALVSFGKAVFDIAANLDEQAEQVGVSTEGLQAYRAALQQNGIETGQTDQILQHLTRSMGQALAATGAQRTAFAQLGLTADDLAGDTESVMPKVAQALLGISSGAVRAQIETDLFGKSGQRLESALRTLANPAADLIEKEKALGQVMGTDLTNAADKAADAMTESWNRMKVAIAPVVVGLTDLVSGLVGEMAALVSLPGEIVSAASAAKGKSADWKLSVSGSASSGLTVDNIPGSVGNPDASDLISGNIPAGSLVSGSAKPKVFDAAAWAKYLADRQEEARLVTLSAAEQSAEKEAIQQSIEKQTINGAAAKDLNKTYAYAVQYLTASELSQARSNGILTAQVKTSKDQVAQLREMEKAADSIIDKYADQYEKQRTAYDGFHDQLKQQVTLAGMSSDERERYLAVQKEITLATAAGLQPQTQWVGLEVQARQEAEKWRDQLDSVASSVTKPCEELPVEFLAEVSAEIAAELKGITA